MSLPTPNLLIVGDRLKGLRKHKLISLYGNETIDVSPTFHFISLENSLLQVIPLISIETRKA